MGKTMDDKVLIGLIAAAIPGLGALIRGWRKDKLDYKENSDDNYRQGMQTLYVQMKEQADRLEEQNMRLRVLVEKQESQINILKNTLGEAIARIEEYGGTTDKLRQALEE